MSIAVSPNGISRTIATPWPPATVALQGAAHAALERELERHAELIQRHDDLVRRYISLLEGGVWLTACGAQDLAADIVETERQVRCLEHQLGVEGDR